MSSTKGRVASRGKARSVLPVAAQDQAPPMATASAAKVVVPETSEIAQAPTAVASLTSQSKETTMPTTNVTNIAADAAAKAKSMIDQSTVQTRATMEKTMEQATKATEGMMKAAEEAAEFGRGNIEAMTKAAQLWASGTQDLARQYAAVAQGFADHAMESAKALSSVKSLKEAADLQASFAKAAFEKSSAETTKFQEAVLRLTESASAPITARMQVAMEKLAKPIAA